MEHGQDVGSMRPGAPLDALHGIDVVTADARKSANTYALLFGMRQWEVRHARLAGASVLIAEAEAPWGSRVVLLEPDDDPSSYRDLLDRRGTSVHTLSVRLRSGCELSDAIAWFARHGIARETTATRGADEHHVFDTRNVLPDYRIAIVADADLPDDEAAPEIWTFESEWPEEIPPLDFSTLGHFGIVVDDVLAAVEGHADVWAIDQWDFADWRPEHGSLDDPSYRGEAVDHGFFCGFSFGHHNYGGFELIEPTSGRSDYERFLASVGPGVHHLCVGTVTDTDRFERASEFLAARGIPVLQSSSLRGGRGVYYYLDTRESLGWIVEAFGILASTFGGGPDYHLDLSHGSLALVEPLESRERMHVRVAVTSLVPAERAEEFRNFWLSRSAEVREQHAGCLQYEILQSAEDPRRFTLMELWENPATYDAHWELERAFWADRSQQYPEGDPVFEGLLTDSLTGMEFYSQQKYALRSRRWLPVSTM